MTKYPRLGSVVALTVIAIALAGCMGEVDDAGLGEQSNAIVVGDPPPIDAATAERLQSAIASWYANPATKALGVVAGVQGPRGRWVSALGARSLDGAPMQHDTVVSFGSITKHFTATMILRLVEQGSVRLDDVVPVPCPDGAACPGGSARVTVRYLLINRSGFYTVIGIDDISGSPWMIAAPDLVFAGNLAACERGEIPLSDPRIAISRAQMIQHEIGSRTPLYLPQSRNLFASPYAYVNSNWMLLQNEIERRTGAGYFPTLQAQVLAPIGVTSFSHSAARDGTAVGISGTFTSAGQLLMVDARGCMGGPSGYGVSGAGGLRGTVADMLRFENALQNGHIVRPDTLALMRAPGGPLGRGLFVGTYGDKYGMGTMITPVVAGQWDGPLMYGHDGGQSGFSAVVRHVPSTGYSIVVVSNTGGRGPEVMALLRTLHAIASAP